MSVVKVIGLQHPNSENVQITLSADGSVDIPSLGVSGSGTLMAGFTNWSDYYTDNSPTIDFGGLSENVDFSNEYFPKNKIDFALGNAETDFGTELPAA